MIDSRPLESVRKRRAPSDFRKSPKKPTVSLRAKKHERLGQVKRFARRAPRDAGTAIPSREGIAVARAHESLRAKEPRWLGHGFSFARSLPCGHTALEFLRAKEIGCSSHVRSFAGRKRSAVGMRAPSREGIWVTEARRLLRSRQRHALVRRKTMARPKPERKNALARRICPESPPAISIIEM